MLDAHLQRTDRNKHKYLQAKETDERPAVMHRGTPPQHDAGAPNVECYWC
jgi:hypothetical protein